MTQTSVTLHHTMLLQASTVTFTGTTIQGTGSCSYTRSIGGFLNSLSSTFETALGVVATGLNRRIDTSTLLVTTLCGSNHGDLTFASSTALLAYLNCSASSTYSSTAGAVTFASGSYLIFDQVSNTSLPLYMTSFTAASDLVVEVINTGVTDYFVTLATYENPGGSGGCTTSFANYSVDGCASGATCSVYGGTDSSNSSLCVITFRQLTDFDDGSNEAYLGLLGLLGIIPIAALLGWMMCHPQRKLEAADKELDLDLEYPTWPNDMQVAQPYTVAEPYDVAQPYLHPSPASAYTPASSPYVLYNP
jgi:hypothetical protein